MMKASPSSKNWNAGSVALTPGERRAYRWGYLSALADAAADISERRIRIAARSVDIRAPREWAQRGEP